MDEAMAALAKARAEAVEVDSKKRALTAERTALEAEVREFKQKR